MRSKLKKPKFVMLTGEARQHDKFSASTPLHNIPPGCRGVRAILEGRKTQTRRVIRNPEKLDGLMLPGEAAEWCSYGRPGDLLWVTMGSQATRTTPFNERFWERVIKFDDCWEWFGRVNKKRYGIIRKGERTFSAHRVSWELHNGAIPSGLHVLHTCDLPWCVNPKHLWIGTNDDNIADKMAKGRHRSPAGEEQRAAKLLWQQVDEIRALYWEQHLYQKDIAVSFGIDQSRVSKIVNEKQWLRKDRTEQLFGHRILRLTDVRVQRVQEISEEDAIAEGMVAESWKNPPPGGFGFPDKIKIARFPVGQFAALWDSINAKRGYGWAINPWVWVLTFEPLPAGGGALRGGPRDGRERR